MQHSKYKKIQLALPFLKYTQMRTSLFILFSLLFSFTAAYTFKNSTQPKSSSSSLYILLEKYYEGHPYRNVNLARNNSSWDINNYKIEFHTMDNYRLRSSVAKGGFAKVFKTTYIPDGTKCVFKQLFDDNEKAMKKEIMMMQEVSDLPNVIPIRDIIRDTMADGSVRTGLILDYFPTIDHIYLFPKLTKSEVKHFIYEALRTIDRAHSRGIFHRDIKPMNVLMNADRLETRVIDWGQSDYYIPGKRYSTSIATTNYMAPELLLNYNFYDYSVDIWSTGCILAEMTFLTKLFFKAPKYTPYPEGGNSQFKVLKLRHYKEQLESIAKIMGTLKLKQFANKFSDLMDVTQLDDIADYPKISFEELITEKNSHLVDPDVIDLLEKMFTYDHTRRITAAEALMHPYFDEVRPSTASAPLESSNNMDLAKWSNLLVEMTKSKH